MNTVRLRGTCPGLSAPLQTGDGLLARLIPAAPISLDAMAGLCEAARRHGNGTLEVSARGSLQVRGLTPRSAPLFASAVAELGIAAHEGVPVIAALDVTGTAVVASRAKGDAVRVGAADVAADLRRAIANAGLRLSPKVSVVVDGGGGLHLDALTADVRLRAAQPSRHRRCGARRFYLGLGGDGTSAVWLGTVADVVHPVIGLLKIIAARGPTVRAAEILRTEGVEAFDSVSAALIEPASAPPRRMPAEMIGLHVGLDGTMSAAIGLAFGHTRADALAEILRLAAIGGARAVWPLPDRALLLIGASVPDALKIMLAAKQLGFVVDADDPRRRIAACPGAPACLSGLIPARALASALAPLLEATPSHGDRPLASPIVEEGRGGESEGWRTQVPRGSPPIPDPSPQQAAEQFAALLRRELAPTAVAQVLGQRRGIALHISGCPKGCAHPLPAVLTLVGSARGCGVVHHGSAGEAPRQYLDPASLCDGIRRLAARPDEAAHG
jgi:precorrin-3B synthase